MYDPIMRVLTVLEVLQARDHVTGAELAERLEVDLRTVQRYIVRLKDLKIPVESSRGVGGAYRLRPGYRLPPLLLTNEEAFALSLGLHSLRQVGLSAFAPATEGALKKLQRVLPETLRESIRTVEDVVAIEPGPWVVTTSVECLIRAASAIRTGRRIRFDYRSHDGAATRRHIEPYAVVHTDGRWYLIGHCLTRRALRTFRLDRVSNLASGAGSFRRPAEFDARQHLRASMPFVQSEYQIDVWIDMPIEDGAAELCAVARGARGGVRRNARALRARPAGDDCGHAAEHGPAHCGPQPSGAKENIPGAGAAGAEGGGKPARSANCQTSSLKS